MVAYAQGDFRYPECRVRPKKNAANKLQRRPVGVQLRETIHERKALCERIDRIRGITRIAFGAQRSESAHSITISNLYLSSAACAPQGIAAGRL
jgi:hypothetical protein